MRTPKPTTSVLISASDAAHLMGVNRATVINWARNGRISGLQYGRRGIYRFDRNEIQRFMEASRLSNRAHE